MSASRVLLRGQYLPFLADPLTELPKLGRLLMAVALCSATVARLFIAPDGPATLMKVIAHTDDVKRQIA